MSHLDMNTTNTIRKTAIASAVSLALGSGVTSQYVSADQISADFTGAFTMLNGGGSFVPNTDTGGAPWFGNRTAITGSMTFDTDAGTGSMTIDPFSFFGNGHAEATAVTLQAIGNGFGGAGDLILGNMGFNWNGNNGIPVSIVLDASGLFGALGSPVNTSDVITGGAAPASDGTVASTKAGTYTVPIGPGPVITTTWNTSTIGTPTLGTNPSGALPLISDAVGGSPMPTAPFKGFNANFDLTDLQVSSFTDTTPPVLTLNGSSVIDLNVGDMYNELGATCNDVQDGNLDGSVVIGGDMVNTVAPGTYTVTYNCEDSAMNPAPQLERTVNVTAAGFPVITLLGTTPVTHEAATPYTDAGATCNDPEDGDISPLNGVFTPPQGFTSTSTVDENVPGNYSVTYECSDSIGNSALQVVRNVNVVDTIPPVITLTPDCVGGIIQIADGTDPTPSATAVDAVDGPVPVNTTGDPVNPNPVFGSSLSQAFNLGYNASDAAGNIAVSSCKITLGNPDPVATLIGDATIVIGSGADYTEQGATCEDFTDGVLPDATPLADSPNGMIDGTTPNGNYTVTYTCGPNTLGNTGTTQRTVIVGVSFSAAANSESNFSMLNPTDDFVGGADDIFFSWDGSLYTDPTTQTAANMFMGSAEPQPFFGFPWEAHDIRAFGPGDYTFPTSRGNLLNLHVAANQIGAHMLFDWNDNNNIDVVLAWDLNGVFVGSSGSANDLGAKGNGFALASIDADGDGIPGVPMADGPFKGFNANFNVKLTPLFALPDAAASAAQGGNDPATVIVSTMDPVTVTATVNPDVNGVFTYQGPFTYDWSMSDAALLTVNTNGTDSATFVFNPNSLPNGPATATVEVTDTPTGLTTTVPVPLQITTGNTTDPNVMDSDADGIPDNQDAINNNITPGQQQGVFGDGSSFVLTSSAGKLVMGETASAVSVASGQYDTTVTGAEVGIPDSNFETSCVGECFSFKVTGLAPGSAVDIVLPLGEGIPADGAVRKLINGTWRDFVTTGGNSAGNAISSAPGAAGNCSAPGPYTPGLTTGNFCLKLTIVDGGPNDADGLANGIVVDPVGVAGGAAAAGKPPGNTGSPNSGSTGCTLGDATVAAGKRGDWWLLAGLLAWLGARVHRRRTH